MLHFNGITLMMADFLPKHNNYMYQLNIPYLFKVYCLPGEFIGLSWFNLQCLSIGTRTPSKPFPRSSCPSLTIRQTTMLYLTHLSILLYIFSLEISRGPSSSDPAASVSKYMSKHINSRCIWLDRIVSHDLDFISSSWWTFTSSSISCKQICFVRIVKKQNSSTVDYYI